MNLAACYRPGGIIDCEKASPRLSPSSDYTVTAGYRVFPITTFRRRFRCLRHIHYLALTQIFGSQEDRPLAFLIPHLRALQRCPIRSLFRIVGSSGSMDGGIMSYHSSYWQPRVARGLGSNGTAKSLKEF